MKPKISPSDEERAWYRNNTPDALYGALTAVEAVLGVLLADIARSPSQAAAHKTLLAMRQRIEATAEREAATTRFGTGGEEILDGRQDALDTIFREADRLTRGDL